MCVCDYVCMRVCVCVLRSVLCGAVTLCARGDMSMQAVTRAYTDSLLVVDASSAMPASAVSVDGVVDIRQRWPVTAAYGSG